MITDGVFRLIGHKPRRGAGRSCPCPGSVGDALPAFIGARPTRACATGLDGDALPAFIGAPSGSPAPVREYCISEGAWRQGNGGGFAALEASCRRVAGVSRLYWCNSPRLVAPSPESMGLAPNARTTSETNSGSRLMRSRWSAMWAFPTFRETQPWLPPTSMPTFPHHKAEKSPFQQHVVSYNPNT